MPYWGQISFQDAATQVMSYMIKFHDHTMIAVVMVLTFVGYMMFALSFNQFTARNIVNAQTVESVWTVVPGIILIFVAIPSIQLLYITDEIGSPEFTLKAIGHQWYWSYEYSEFPDMSFDSYMIPTDQLTTGQPRLLEVDNRVVLPYNSQIRVLVTAADVIHAWTVPALGVKADAIPGRLNQIGFAIQRPGVYYGQCSEICGANHSFMPIAVEAISYTPFIKWASKGLLLK